MKKCIIATLLSGLFLLSACYDDTELLNRMDQFETATTSFVNQQYEAITSSISSLESMDAELKATIASLQTSSSSSETKIEELKAYDESLEQKIKDLKVYVMAQDGELVDWAEQAFCTIEKYNAIVTEMQELQTKFSDLSTELNSKIEESAAAIKLWVNEALAAYSTKEETAAVAEQLKTLSAKVDTLSADITKLMERIQSIVYIPEYTDGCVTVNFGRSGSKLTYEQNSVSFRIRPQDAAVKLAAQVESLSLQARYTATRSAACDVELSISSATAKGDVLTLWFTGAELEDEFFDGEEGASMCLLITDGNNDLTSEYVPLLAVQEAIVSIPETLTLNIGATEKLEAEVSPAGTAVTWHSSNEKVATVDKDGNVTGVAEGKAVITATVSSGKVSKCTVTVLPAVKVESIALSKSTSELEVGQSETLTVTFNPTNASNKNVSWMSMNDDVAIVENGKVTAIAEGTVVIVAVSEDGSKSATCTYTIKAASGETVAVTGVSLDKTTATLAVGATLTLAATIAPETATNKNVTWASSDDKVASVDVTGKVTAIKAGTATITVTTEDGAKTATCAVTVTAAEEEETSAEYVDLGLSVKWATKNIGASSAYEVGSYFAWGATTTSTSYDSESYSKLAVSKEYNSTDHLTTLDSKYDAAKAILGNHWRMPTREEWQELLSYTTVSYDSTKRVYTLTSTKIGYTDKSIIIYVGGYKNGEDTKDSGIGYYWTTDIYTTSNYNCAASSYLASTFNNYCSTSGLTRYYGALIRPVYVPEPVTE